MSRGILGESGQMGCVGHHTRVQPCVRRRWRPEAWMPLFLQKDRGDTWPCCWESGKHARMSFVPRRLPIFKTLFKLHVGSDGSCVI